MSEYLTLKNPEAIDNWMEQNYPIYYPDGGGKAMTPQELIEYTEEEQPDQLLDGGLYFGVSHTVYDTDGWPLVTVQRVFTAKDAEEAMAKYVFKPSKQISGRGNNYLAVILRTSLTDRPQEISVFKLAEGTDSFY